MENAHTLVRAFALAHELHEGQSRKSTGVSYLSHLMAVAALVDENGGREEVVIAALLHDAVEDQGGPATLARIHGLFGAEVAGLVEAATDADTHPKPPWRARKEAHLARLASAPEEVRLLVTADKLHNARDLAEALRRDGDAVWTHFTGGREGTLWYYAEMARILGDGWPHPIAERLTEAVETLHQMALAETA